MNSLINQITLSAEEKHLFSENGFIKLKKLLTSEASDALRKLTYNSSVMKSPSKFYSGDISRMAYNLENTITQDICFSENLKYIWNQLTDNRGATFIQESGLKLNQIRKDLIGITIFFHFVVPRQKV